MWYCWDRGECGFGVSQMTYEENCPQPWTKPKHWLFSQWSKHKINDKTLRTMKVNGHLITRWVAKWLVWHWTTHSQPNSHNTQLNTCFTFWKVLSRQCCLCSSGTTNHEWAITLLWFGVFWTNIEKESQSNPGLWCFLCEIKLYVGWEHFGLLADLAATIAAPMQ